jgi:hypothetical protein
LVVTVNTHKLSLIFDAAGLSSGQLSDCSFLHEVKTMHDFLAHLHNFQDCDSIVQGVFSYAELKLRFRSQGDGFTLALLPFM